MACLTTASGTWDRHAGTWAAAGPVTVYTGADIENACQIRPHPGCRWLNRGVSDWEIVGPALVRPRSTVTVEVATVARTILRTLPVDIRIGRPPAGG